MKKIIFYFLVSSFFILGCSSDNDVKLQNTKITINFNHSWEDEKVTKDDFNDVKFTNKNGEKVSIEEYRYLLSNIRLVDANNIETKLSDYLLINVGEEKNLSFSTEQLILEGTYSLQFNFGFSGEDNEKDYNDLNSVNFNVPSDSPLNGGYHYMQFDGKYTSSSTTTPAPFNYHAVKAEDIKNPAQPTPREPRDTSFGVTLSDILVNEGGEVIINVNSNMAEWFENPHTWDLNKLNTVLMPDYDAQILMNENGQSVFSLQTDM